jgi:lipoteichoic acid synthase
MDNINSHLTNGHRRTSCFIPELLYWIFSTGFIMFKAFHFQFETLLNARPYRLPVNLYMAAASFGVVIIAASVVLLLFNKKRLAALFALNFIISLLLAADAVYFRYYYTALSIPVLYQIGLVGSIGDSVRSLVQASDILFFADLPFLLVGLVLLKKTSIKKIAPLKRIIIALVAAAVGFGIFQTAYPKTDTTTYDNNYVIKHLGVLYFQTFDVSRHLTQNILENKKLSPDESRKITEVFKNNGTSGSRYTGTAKGKNLIIVQVEALQGFVIGREINGREITPNLNRLAQNSIYFNNFYHQVAGGNTSDAEFLCNTSLYPASEGAVYFRYPTNTYYSLPKILKEQGYDSYAFHAYTPSFWNRTEMYKSIGFDTFINYNDYEIDEFAGWGGWALSDRSFLRQSLDKINNDRPFYGFFITLSSHHPFDYFDENSDFDPGKYKGTYLGNYFSAINYVDECIGGFIQNLKDRGMYDNTLLVIFGDHSALPRAQADQLMEFMNVEDTEFEWSKLQKVPLIIHSSDIPGGETVSKTGGQIDIMPTIANLMGFKPPYALGKDLLNTDKGYAVFRNGSYVTDEYFYLSGLDAAYNIETGGELERAEYSQELEVMHEQLKISDLILQKNALKKISLGDG